MKTARHWAVVILMLGLSAGSCVAQSLEDAASTFASMWGARDMSRLEGSLSPAGIRLQWESRQLGSLDPRHAAASVREYLGGREETSTRVSRVEEVGGQPPQGYAEIRWDSRIQGTSDFLTRTLFVAFVSEGGDWRVTEIRVLPLSRS